MKNQRGKVLWGFNLGVLIPTLIYFLSLYFYGFMTQQELLLSLTTPRAWMLFVLIYYPLLNLFLFKRMSLLTNYLEDPQEHMLPQVQKRIASLPRVYIINVMIYSTLGAGSLLFFEEFFTSTEKLLGLFLGFAFCFVYALPFFVSTVMRIERWTKSIPLSEKYRFLTLKGKLYVNLFCNVFGVIVVIGVLNLGIVIAQLGEMSADQLLQLLLFKNGVVGLACLLIVVINVGMLSKQIIDPIAKTTQLFREIAEGDLTQMIDVSSKDEIGILNTWSDRFVEKIQNVIGRVGQSAGLLDTSAEELISNIDLVTLAMHETNDAASQIALRAENTSETISQVVQSAMFMDATIHEVASYSQMAVQQGNETVNVAQEGQQIVAKTIEKMDEIRDEMKYQVDTIEQLGDAVVRIEQIVKMISEIARKTNLLALNASIEAARVGSSGKGFMVVAQSIGKLSEESGESVTQIVQLVEEIRQVASGSVHQTKEGMEKVERELEWVKKTSEAFDQIYSGIRQTTDTIQEIAAATEEQSQESSKIMNSIQDVNEMAIHVSGLVEEQVATTQEIVVALSMVNSSSNDSTSQTLVTESKELYNLISQFKV